MRRWNRGNPATTGLGLMLSFLLMLVAGCDGGDGITSAIKREIRPPAAPSPGRLEVSGIVAYEFVPPRNVCQGLDFSSIQVRPIRAATVELLDAGGARLDTTTSDDTGNYLFTGVPEGADLRIRVRAELKRTGQPAWDVEVRDNVVDLADPSPPPLAARPLYTISGSVFNSGTSNVRRNLTATTGWGGSGYTGNRAAAPFAVLDTIYSAMQLVLSVDPEAEFGALDAYWSVNNTLASTTNIHVGNLGSSFFTADPERDGELNPSLFLLGDASVDTEEFDDHVIVHEWGHYFETNFSRSDSTGGPHFVGDRLDARLAFGEGWATALSGIALDNPIYCDTGPAGSNSGFAIGTEEGSYDARGWYDEISVLRFIYDLWDDNDEGGDTGSIGFQPIFDVMTGPQASTDAFTTVFSFAAALRATLSPADQNFLDTQLLREDMTPGFDAYGVGELNDAAGGRDVLPVYTDLTANGSVTNVCLNDDFDRFREGNKLAAVRYLRIDVPARSEYELAVRTTTTALLPADDPRDPRDQSDPDIDLFRDGRVVARGIGGDANEETLRTPTLTGPDIYVADLREFRYADPQSPAGFPDRMCFDVSMTPVQ
jgi:hypothetical protein